MSGKPLSEDEKWFIRTHNPSRSVGHEIARKYYQQTGKLPPNLKYLDKAYTETKTAALSTLQPLRFKRQGSFSAGLKLKKRKPAEKFLKEREQQGVELESKPGVSEDLVEQELTDAELAKQRRAQRSEDLEFAQTRLKQRLKGTRATA